MIEYGYGGRILRINLTKKEFKIEKLQLSWIKKVIGGRPANSLRLYEELDPDCDPLGPNNMLIFGIGPLTGTLLPASAFFIVSAKSPMTGILGDSAAGGQFAAEMKQTGFDQIIITGKSENLIYLKITEKGVDFIEANHLKGKDIITTTSTIRKENRDFAMQVAAIGVAGENQVHYASIVSSGNRVNGRTGMGAVMGSKNIKAVSVRGKKPVKIADTLTFLAESKKIQETIVKNDEYKKRYELGTTMLMNDLNSIGILPTKHFKEGVCDYVDDISGERLADIFKVKNKACYNCNVHCSRYYVTENAQAEGPEFETLCGFSSRIGSSDLDFALEMNQFVNQNGMDSLSSCEVIGWLMECQEKGLIKPEDVDGLEIKWGDTKVVRKLMQMIVNKEGVGAKLAEGATKFSKNFSEEAQKLVMQVKGLDIICGDPRGIKAYGLTYAIASRGADHLRAEPYFELTQQYKIAKKRFGTEKAADRLAEEGKAALVTYSEKIALLTDSLTMCKNVGLCMDVLNFENTAKILTAATGIKFTAESLVKTLENAVDLDYKLNKKFGLKKEQDVLPDRFTKEALKNGPTKGSIVDIKKMVDEYYKLHNWDTEEKE
jgi:aldehyde:ferredoxin oxidoreductase